jgi:ribosomal protein S18 acetylase RimI-like enzyme
MHVERATLEDLRDIWLVDENVRGHSDRRRRLMEAVEKKHCLVAKEGFTVVGYAVREPTFFGYPFIAMMIVHPGYRGKGVIEEILEYIEMTTPEDRIFTSVEQTDDMEQQTYESFGFERSGEVYNVSKDDTAYIIYIKRLA